MPVVAVELDVVVERGQRRCARPPACGPRTASLLESGLEPGRRTRGRGARRPRRAARRAGAAARPPPGRSFSGTSTSMRTSRSPRPRPRSDGTPRPLSRNTWPGCVPGGTTSSSGPFERLDREPAPERRLRERDRRDVHEVVAVALELGVRRDRDRDVQVAGNAAARRGRAPAGAAAAAGRCRPRREPRRRCAARACTRPSPRQSRHGDRMRLPVRVAGRARRRRDHLAEDRAAHLAHLAGAAAHVAAGRVRTGLAARAVAALALDGQPDLDRCGRRRTRPRRAQLDRRPRRRSPAAVRPAAAPPKASPPKNASNRSPSPKRRRPARRRAAPAARRRTEHVVAAAALRVAQRLVRAT